MQNYKKFKHCHIPIFLKISSMKNTNRPTKETQVLKGQIHSKIKTLIWSKNSIPRSRHYASASVDSGCQSRARSKNASSPHLSIPISISLARQSRLFQLHGCVAAFEASRWSARTHACIASDRERRRGWRASVATSRRRDALVILGSAAFYIYARRSFAASLWVLRTARNQFRPCCWGVTGEIEDLVLKMSNVLIQSLRIWGTANGIVYGLLICFM